MAGGAIARAATAILQAIFTLYSKRQNMTLLTHAQRETDVQSVSRRMTKWMDRVFALNYHKFCPAEAWTPSINLYEDDKQYVVVADLAGVKGEAIDVRVESRGMMVLSGSRDMPEIPSQHGQVRLHLMEIDHGSFCRSLELPADADLDSIEANYRAGFLYVSVAKKEAK